MVSAWLFVVVLVPVTSAVAWTLWQTRLIMPVKFASTHFGRLAECREGPWAGKETGQYVKAFGCGSFCWGYNPETRDEFVIFNGKVGYKSFQIQNWRPRFAIWGGPIIKRRSPIKAWTPTDPSELKKFVWPKGTQAELSVYPENHPQRRPTEAYFAEDVRRNIHDVRAGNDVNLWLLIESLRNLEDQRYTHGFHAWLWAIEAVLGAEACRGIGKVVCEQEGFTIEEGERLQTKAA
jgi:hypothetical protein